MTQNKKAAKRKKAVALKYEAEKQTAPSVVAKGMGQLAERIIETAKQAGIPIKKDPDLLETLSKLDINQEIPPELYRVIAETLAWVYKVNKSYKAP